ncbi:hypothetical protein ACFCV8_06655 [Streptomyces sp. NPDC056347]|uniref:hypothetical protein n=1 Tax=Streptomyces sp. NPDC056347 TaxID=3345790 RepID=UPI0035DC03DE
MMRHVKLSAVLLVVVLALTGFSTSGHGRSGKSSGKSHGSSSSSGGGCSNSKKSNNGYHSGYDDDDDYGSSSSSSGGTDYATQTPSPSTTGEPRVSVVRCAQPRKGKRRATAFSTVSLTANGTGSHSYEVAVTFLDARGRTVDTGTAYQDAEGGNVVELEVRMDHPGRVSRVKKCRAEAELTY